MGSEDVQLDASLGLTVGSGDPAPANPPNHPQGLPQSQRDHGLHPRLVPVDFVLSAPSTALTVAKTGVWLVSGASPSQGKLWNIRSVSVSSDDPSLTMNAGVALNAFVFVGARLRNNGQSATAEPGPDIAQLLIGEESGTGAATADWGRYEKWVHPGEYISVFFVPGAVGAGTGTVYGTAYIDQYDQSDVLPRWQA